MRPSWDIFPFNWSVKKEDTYNIFTLFCSDFPDRVRAEDLFGLFRCVGKCVKVLISPRKNKRGKRFGFSRFKEDGDARLFALKINSIQIDGRKIHANIPRFDHNVGRSKFDGFEG